MGRCFVRGNILFIKPGHKSEENGYLKGEFLDQINRLSKWEKTKYYCTGFNIVKCKADQNQKTLSVNNRFPQQTTQDDVSFRLGQFEIVEKRGRKLLWKSYSGRADIKVGKAFVDDNILFLGHSESEITGIPKKDFLERISLLPLWERTDYYCHRYSLYSCETDTICFGFDENVLLNKDENDTGPFKNHSPQIESNLMQKNATENFVKNYSKTFWSFCSICLLFLFKVLFWLIIIILKALKIFIEGCALGGKRLLKRVLKFLN
jgi:hypothetical protein